jgi:hypothetical protein
MYRVTRLIHSHDRIVAIISELQGVEKDAGCSINWILGLEFAVAERTSNTLFS